jgi:hypothetical protein
MADSTSRTTTTRPPVYDRWYLLGDKRNELLALREVEQYGRDSFGDPDYVSLYGLTPREWDARGARLGGVNQSWRGALAVRLLHSGMRGRMSWRTAVAPTTSTMNGIQTTR